MFRRGLSDMFLTSLCTPLHQPKMRHCPYPHGLTLIWYLYRFKTRPKNEGYKKPAVPACQAEWKRRPARATWRPPAAQPSSAPRYAVRVRLDTAGRWRAKAVHLMERGARMEDASWGQLGVSITRCVKLEEGGCGTGSLVYRATLIVMEKLLLETFLSCVGNCYYGYLNVSKTSKWSHGHIVWCHSFIDQMELRFS